jgi:hypothetical protein
MTVVSSKEFAINQKKYYNLAVEGDVFIKRGKNIFQLTCTNRNNSIVNDDDDYDAELLALAKERLDGEFTSADDFISFLRCK